jgi:phosphoribosylformylglycinamidine cyclo-ligase
MAALTYRDAGVDIDRKADMIDRIGDLVKRTFTPGVLHELGSYGGMISGLFPHLKEPVLVATNDGVGTKVRTAVRAGRVRGLGHDIVNHCVNDALVQGAQPLFFLDYFAANKLDDAIFHEVVAGMSEALQEAGAALLGGETAEMPGVYAAGEFDVVGFLVGVVEKARIWPRHVGAGDVLLGLRSNGLHTNGFSLVNRLIERDALDVHADPGGLGESLASALLRPHRSYLKPVRRLEQAVEIHALAHITGGGIQDNLPRVLPPGVGAEVDRLAWTPNPIFRLLLERTGMGRDEAFHVLNMGCGLIVVVPRGSEARALATLKDAGEEAWVIGQLVPGEGVRFTR